jgi:hypothetical protein
VQIKIDDPAIRERLEVYVKNKTAHIIIKVSTESEQPAPLTAKPTSAPVKQYADVVLPPDVRHADPQQAPEANARLSSTPLSLDVLPQTDAVIPDKDIPVKPLNIQTLNTNPPDQLFRLEPIEVEAVKPLLNAVQAQDVVIQPATNLTTTPININLDLPVTPQLLAPITEPITTAFKIAAPSPLLFAQSEAIQIVELAQLPPAILSASPITTQPVQTHLAVQPFSTPTLPDIFSQRPFQNYITHVFTPQISEQPQQIVQKTPVSLSTPIEGIQFTPLALSAPLTTPVQSSEPLISLLENLPKPILNNLQAGKTQAVVITQTQQNLPVIAIPKPQLVASSEIAKPLFQLQDTQFFILHAPFETVPTGSIIAIAPQAVNAPSPETSALLTPQAAISPQLFFTPQPWETMNQIMQTLSQVAPPVAQAMSAMVPNPATPSQMAPATLFFIAAVRSGDIQGWLGEKATEAIRRAGQGRLITQLGLETATQARGGAEPLSDGWRGTGLPLMWQNEIHKAVIYYRREDPDGSDSQDKGQKPLRFVMDLDMNALGPIQLDALFKPGRLDMIVRSETQFSQAMHQDMRRLYMDAIKHAGVGGELLFQTDVKAWVKVEAKHTQKSLDA